MTESEFRRAVQELLAQPVEGLSASPTPQSLGVRRPKNRPRRVFYLSGCLVCNVDAHSLGEMRL
jgi:hypothetical protein